MHSMAEQDPHYDQWTKLYEKWKDSQLETDKFKALCVRGLLDGTTYKSNGELF